jgi:hypothetical protein
VWHRRSGKEKTFVNYTAKRMFQRIGTYFYFFPTFNQGRRAVWDGRDRSGLPFMAHFPAELFPKRNESEMKVTAVNGSIFQIVGSDNIDPLMSTNPVGCVFAEYSLQHPRAWDYMRPILRENGGWAVFDYTPRGRNHGYALYDLARRLQASGDPAWYAEVLTVSDTGVLSQADIEAERREGMDDDMIQQEYYCSFSGAQQGSIFGREIKRAEDDGRICTVPYMPEYSVSTWWDIGLRDAMAIWFTQDVGRAVHVVDYYEHSGEGLPHYAQVLDERAKRYGIRYATHNAPHDIVVKEVGSGKSRIETAEQLGIHFEVVPNIGLQDGIEAARAFFARCYFDAERTAQGRLALISYHRVYDALRKCFTTQPYHDWSSNGSDAFRYLAVGHSDTVPVRRQYEPPAVYNLGDTGTGWMAA